ncbi:MAG: hypothetical protein ORO03_01130 [Alphaproteobacteria bacterium]|nr:hypothetical protein [Alphaproteobacteria bacterium]
MQGNTVYLIREWGGVVDSLEHPMDAMTLLDFLPSHIDKDQKTTLPRRCIIAGSRNRQSIFEISAFLASSDCRIDFAREISEVMDLLRCEDQVYDLCIVSIDDLGGIGRVFRGLRKIRIAYPDVSIIITSEKSYYDDFTAERLPITDVSMREPILPGSLVGAMVQCFLNNRLWRERHRLLGYDCA